MSTPRVTHERLVEEILRRHPDAKRRFFARFLRKIYREEEPRWECDEECAPGCDCGAEWDREFAAFCREVNIIPDAWAYRVTPKGRREIWCWEVHVTTTPSQKMARYTEMFWALDPIGPYHLRLIHVDAFGNEMESAPDANPEEHP